MSLLSVKTTVLIIVISLLLVIPAFCYSDTEDEEPKGKTIVRLLNDTRPLTYHMHFITNIHKCDLDFSGQVSIKLEVLNDTDRIVIHAGDFSQIKLNLMDAHDGSEVENVTFTHDNETQILTVLSESTPLDLKAGEKYILSISYETQHNEDPAGFFKAAYGEGIKDEGCIAMTDFEPDNARLAFPCYDEPIFKAKFTIKITHGSNYTALSSMPLDGEPIVSEEDDEMTTSSFKETPLISTYIIAFAVTNYENISSKKYNVKHRVFAPPNSHDKGEFALEMAVEGLKLLEDYFEIKFPSPKIDHISVRGLNERAMENWGLIIYKKGYLLPSSNTSQMFNLDRALTITHELTHQWLGNLVSPKWWTWTWLNEGLTTFYSYKILDKLNPEWNAKEFALTMELTQMVYSYTSEDPLSKYVEKSSELNYKFGTDSYYKAAYTLNMFEHALTEATLRKGVINYLKHHLFSVVDEDDFFRFIQSAATEDGIEFFKEDGAISKVMKTWTQQAAYPVVNVTRNYTTGEITLAQTPYCSSCNETNSDSLWYIPITYATASQPDFQNTSTDFIFPPIENMTINSSKPLKKDDWLILNKNEIGLYLVAYDKRNWELIIKTLKRDFKAIPSHNKAQLVRDALTFFKADQMSLKILIDLLTILKEDDDEITWITIVIVLQDIIKDWENDQTKEIVKYFGRDIIKGIFQRIFSSPKGNSNDSPLIENLKNFVFLYACTVDIEECKVTAKNIFMEMITNPTTIQNEMKMEFYCEGFRSIERKDFDIIMERLKSETRWQEQDNLFKGLICSRNFDFMNYMIKEIEHEETSDAFAYFLKHFIEV